MLMLIIFLLPCQIYESFNSIRGVNTLATYTN